MVEFLLIQKFLVALALGTLIGLEREYARYKQRGHSFAGIRTFPLIALFGALSAYLGATVSPYLLLAGMVLCGLLIIVAYFMIARHTLSNFGATSEVAAFLTFFIGVLAYNQEFSFATILAIFITLILFARSVLHNFAEKITKKEMTDTLIFAVISFLILPFLPDKGYGPLEMFNPYTTWLMVVLISGISFVGYALMKWFGEKGIALTGILGGLASSTATTTNFAQRSLRERSIYRSLVLGVILANGVMLVRILVEVFVVNPDLFALLILPLLLLILLSAGFSYAIWRKARIVKGKVHLTSPLTLGPALKFAIIFAVVLGLVKITNIYFPAQGIYILSLISGIADVDAITLSLSQLALNGLAMETARNGIIIAALMNIAVKGGISWWLGGREFRNIIAVLFGILIVVGIGLIFLL